MTDEPEKKQEKVIPTPLPTPPSISWEDWQPAGPFPLPPIPKWMSKPLLTITFKEEEEKKPEG